MRRVREGDVLTWRCDAAAPDEPTTVRCPALPGALAEGDTLLIDDGQLSCKVLASDADTGRILTVATNDSFFGPAQRVEVFFKKKNCLFFLFLFKKLSFFFVFFVSFFFFLQKTMCILFSLF